MPDQTITCVDCAQTFPFTERDQEFYKEKGFQTPKRCKPCRDIKKAERASQPPREGGGEQRQRDQGRRERHSG